MKRILGNRTVRKGLMLCCLAVEPCIHMVGAVTGVHIAHPEGISNFAIQYLMVDA